jgi:hypothetical protein
MNADDLPPQNSNRWRSRAYGSAVALLLRDWGMHDVRVASRSEAGDLAGLPGWVLTARSPRNVEISTSLDEVARTARSVIGAPLPAAILARRGRCLEESYVVMELADFADVVARLHRTTGAPLSTRIRHHDACEP